MHDYRTTTLFALACALASACLRPADVPVETLGRSTPACEARAALELARRLAA